MRVICCTDRASLGRQAAVLAAEQLRDALRRKPTVRLLLSTGMSQFETLDWLVREDVDWPRVEIFHLDEYVALPDTHRASFRKYIRERFLRYVPVRQAYLVNGDDPQHSMAELDGLLRAQPVDVGLVGIGENAHIAFNDPPADFEKDTAYHIVWLDDRCRAQQVREGWFDSVSEVPARAVSMTVRQILRCEHIISSVPGSVKAEAVLKTVTGTPDPMVPATALKSHPDWTLVLDSESAALLPKNA